VNITTIKSYCLGFAFDDLGRVCLITKDKPDWQKGKLNGVGGSIEPGEMPIDAMVREFKEETGVEVPIWRWTHFGTMQGIAGWQVELFHCQCPEIRDVRTAEREHVQLYAEHEVGRLVGVQFIENIPALVALSKLCASGNPVVTINYEK
jgi:8-oxo-dGTP diphosphatase